VVVVIDVLRFTTAVEVAVARGALVLPYPWYDGSEVAFAREQRAELAGRGDDPSSTWSLSPTVLSSIPAGTRLVLPSPNGSTLAFGARRHGATTVLAGCLRNARAIAIAALAAGGAVSVVAAGERWDGSAGPLRPALEDLLGAGAVLNAAIEGIGSRVASPEARAASAAFRDASADLPDALATTGSGRALAERGRADDVAMASAHDVSDCVPTLVDSAFVRG
jgi:2-phosphosulfolactate phosphatase